MRVFGSDKTQKFRKIVSLVITITFIFSSVVPPQSASAQVIPMTVLNLPLPGAMVVPTSGFTPTLLKGITIYPENPLEFDFIVNTGDTKVKDDELRDESLKLVKYFLATLTVPEEELWVNLSPYERNKIIPESFGVTDMGRDLLAQDYLLKQLAASMMYPEKELGNEFWKRVYSKAKAKFGTTDIPLNTFNKIWIVPEKAVVYVHGTSTFVVESHLKVMLEEDYVALNNAMSSEESRAKFGFDKDQKISTKEPSAVSSAVIQEVLIPEIEKEVNEGKNFSNLRQVYSSMILAAWYKKNLKESLLGQVYVDKNKIAGIDIEDKNIKQRIYDQYLEAFKVGVYDYIKEDYDPVTQNVVPRKYFSGGFFGNMDMLVEERSFAQLTPAQRDKAMSADDIDSFTTHVGLIEADEFGRNKKALTLAGLIGKYAGVAKKDSAMASVGEIENLVFGVITETLAQQGETITPETELYADLNQDSLGVQELAFDIEAAGEKRGLEIRIEDAEVAEFVKVGDIIELIKRKVPADDAMTTEERELRFKASELLYKALSEVFETQGLFPLTLKINKSEIDSPELMNAIDVISLLVAQRITGTLNRSEDDKNVSFEYLITIADHWPGENLDLNVEMLKAHVENEFSRLLKDYRPDASSTDKAMGDSIEREPKAFRDLIASASHADFSRYSVLPAAAKIIVQEVYATRRPMTLGQAIGKVRKADRAMVALVKDIPLFSEPDPEKLPWGNRGVDLVLEGTGRFTTEEGAGKHITAGAGAVVITAPGKGDGIVSVAPGAVGNIDDLANLLKKIFDCASCTTNSLAGAVGVILDYWGIKSGNLVTTHAITKGDSPLETGFFLASTGAADALVKAYPHLKGKLMAKAVRANIPVGSISEFSFVIEEDFDVNENDLEGSAKKAIAAINEVFRRETGRGGSLEGILGFSEGEGTIKGRMSTNNILGSKEAGVFIAEETKIANGNHVTISIMYDNVVGYSNRVVDLIAMLGARLGRTPRIAFNGWGEIGKTVMRLALQRDLDVDFTGGINDLDFGLHSEIAGKGVDELVNIFTNDLNEGAGTLLRGTKAIHSRDGSGNHFLSVIAEDVDAIAGLAARKQKMSPIILSLMKQIKAKVAARGSDNAMTVGVLEEVAMPSIITQKDGKKDEVEIDFAEKYSGEVGSGKIDNPRSRQLIADLAENFTKEYKALMTKRHERLAGMDRGDIIPGGKGDVEMDMVIEDADGNKLTVREILESDWEIENLPEPLRRAGAILTGPWTPNMGLSAVMGREITDYDRESTNAVLNQLQVELPEGLVSMIDNVVMRKQDGKIATLDEKVAYVQGKVKAIQEELERTEKVTPVRIFADLQDAVRAHGDGTFEGPQTISNIVNDRQPDIVRERDGKVYSRPPTDELPVITTRIADFDVQNRHIKYKGADVADVMTSLVYAIESIHSGFEGNANQAYSLVIPKTETPEEVVFIIKMKRHIEKVMGITEPIPLIFMNETNESALKLDLMLWAGRKDIKITNVGRWDKGASDMRTFWYAYKKVYGDLGKVGMDKTLMDFYVRHNLVTAKKRGMLPEGGMVTMMSSEEKKRKPADDQKAITSIVVDKMYEWLLGYDYAWVASPTYVPLVQILFQQPREFEAELEDLPYEQTVKKLLEFPEVPLTRQGIYDDVYEDITYGFGTRNTSMAVAIDSLTDNTRGMRDGATGKKTNYHLSMLVKSGAKLDTGETVTIEMIEEIVEQVMADHGARYGQFVPQSELDLAKHMTLANTSSRHMVLWEKDIKYRLMDKKDDVEAVIAEYDELLEAYNQVMDGIFGDAAMLVSDGTKWGNAFDKLIQSRMFTYEEKKEDHRENIRIETKRGVVRSSEHFFSIEYGKEDKHWEFRASLPTERFYQLRYRWDGSQFTLVLRKNFKWQAGKISNSRDLVTLDMDSDPFERFDISEFGALQIIFNAEQARRIIDALDRLDVEALDLKERDIEHLDQFKRSQGVTADAAMMVEDIDEILDLIKSESDEVKAKAERQFVGMELISFHLEDEKRKYLDSNSGRKAQYVVILEEMERSLSRLKEWINKRKSDNNLTFQDLKETITPWIDTLIEGRGNGVTGYSTFPFSRYARVVRVAEKEMGSQVARQISNKLESLGDLNIEPSLLNAIVDCSILSIRLLTALI